MEWTKNVAQPIWQVAPRLSLRGLKEDYGESTADVVLLAGEIHLGRKPVIWLRCLALSSSYLFHLKGCSPFHK
jgi:hypothetical protein